MEKCDIIISSGYANLFIQIFQTMNLFCCSGKHYQTINYLKLLCVHMTGLMHVLLTLLFTHLHMSWHIIELAHWSPCSIYHHEIPGSLWRGVSTQQGEDCAQDWWRHHSQTSTTGSGRQFCVMWPSASTTPQRGSSKDQC